MIRNSHKKEAVLIFRTNDDLFL